MAQGSDEKIAGRVQGRATWSRTLGGGEVGDNMTHQTAVHRQASLKPEGRIPK